MLQIKKLNLTHKKDLRITAPSQVQRTHKFHGLSFSRYFIILRTTFASSSGGIGLL